MELRKLLQPGCDNGEAGKREFTLVVPGDSGVIIGCDLEAEPGLQKIGKEGAKSRKGNRPFALFDPTFRLTFGAEHLEDSICPQ